MAMARTIRQRMNEWVSGHWSIGPVVFYGRNAMHFAVNIKTRWGFVCFKPPTRCFGVWWPAYFYVSPDATPQHPQCFGWGRDH